MALATPRRASIELSSLKHANHQAVSTQLSSAEASLSEREGLIERERLTQNDHLTEKFDVFNKLSRQLSDSYSVLEHRVADLTQELNTVSAQRMTELAEKERIADRLENLLSVLPGGVIVLDSRGRVAEANHAAREMLGEPLDGLQWREVIQRCFQPREDDGHEISTKDGRRYSVSTRSLSAEGQIILLTDQTETRRLQGELSRHERLSALGGMVSALAHQIRTPLSAAMLYAGHLSGGALSKQQQQSFSDKLLKRLNHMERQVQDMLTFVKGDLPLHDVITVQQLEKSLSEEVEVVLSTNRVNAQWLNSCPNHLVRCHKDALIGAILNLINNAVQAQPHNPELQICFSQVNNKEISISVRDHGTGISPDTLSRVKDVFVTTKPQGTGLGLAVVESVAKRHGGNFKLESELGVGTEATICLPLAQYSTAPVYSHSGV
jgi:two-component system sensor histidine kinase FlrB